MAIGNIFIDKVKHENYSIHPLINGLSDQDAQIYKLIILLWKKILAKLKANENLINPLYLNLQLISAMKIATTFL